MPQVPQKQRTQPDVLRLVRHCNLVHLVKANLKDLALIRHPHHPKLKYKLLRLLPTSEIYIRKSDAELLESPQ